MRKILLYSVIGLMLLSCQKEKVNPGIIDPPEEPIILGDPVITAISPTQGGPLSVFTITGNNFSSKKEENEVTINGVTARIISVNKTTIQAEVPENAETGPVTVRVVSKTVTGSEFTILRIPVYVYITETYAGIGTVSGYVEGNRAGAKFKAPEGVDFDSHGNLIVADRDNHVIRKISPDGEVSLVAGVPESAGSDDGPAASAKFKAPLKVALDAQDNIYVADRDNNKIRRIDAVTGNVTTVAGSGDKDFAEGVGAAAKFNTPVDVVVANDGTIYVADAGNNRIRKITTNGTVSTLAGDGTRAFLEGTGTGAKLADPSGIDIDNDGNIIVADRRNHRIRKITPAGETSTIAGTGTAGYTNGLATIGTFSMPFGVVVASDGSIYVAELSNQSVRMISPDGMLSTIGGNDARTAGWEDGNPSKYNSPTDLAVDAAGRIYVAEIGNHVIRRIIRTEK